MSHRHHTIDIELALFLSSDVDTHSPHLLWLGRDHLNAALDYLTDAVLQLREEHRKGCHVAHKRYSRACVMKPNEKDSSTNLRTPHSRTLESSKRHRWECCVPRTLTHATPLQRVVREGKRCTIEISFGISSRE